MNELALFAGAGGGILGGKLLGWRTVCAVELDAHARNVLLARQRDGVLPRFPIWDDVCTFDGTPWRGRVDVVTGGFPCTDLSYARTWDSGGKYVERGLDGERSGLWREQARIIREVRPRFAFVENVTALLAGWMGTVLGDLAEMGYDAQWGVLPASSVGAPHHRPRVFLVAHANSERRGEKVFVPWCLTGKTLPQASKREFGRAGFISGDGAWQEGREIVDSLVGVDDRLPEGMDALKTIGNAQSPAVAALAWDLLC